MFRVEFDNESIKHEVSLKQEYDKLTVGFCLDKDIVSLNPKTVSLVADKGVYKYIFYTRKVVNCEIKSLEDNADEVPSVELEINLGEHVII